MSHVFRNFPGQPAPPSVERAEGIYIHTREGKKVLDTTAGGTSFAIVGWNHPEVNAAISAQMTRFTHIDYKIWLDENLEELADVLVRDTRHQLDKVYFAGNSGAEACEAAMRMSYQVHFDLGKAEKIWFISREQSYHGATADALVLGERPNLEFFRKGLSPYRARIPMHHPLYLKRDDETLDEYARRSARELEDKILEIGPDKVAGFVGETIMGGLVGNVPPAPNYWRYIREVCDRHDVHLILDEVYCGTGSSGQFYCCDWDEVRPDFIFIGKTLAAGYGALSAVITSSAVEDTVANGQQRLQHTSTFQAHSLSSAAALAVQKIVHDADFLADVVDKGKYFSDVLTAELAPLPVFREVRGRGLRLALEYQCDNNNEFGMTLARNLLEQHDIFVDAKWHRINFTPSLLIERDELDRVLQAVILEFEKLV